MLPEVRLEVFRHLLSSIAEEMGGLIARTSFSPNIKERLDFSCAVFSAGGELAAQAAHIPVHLGAMPLSVQAAIARGAPFAPGDAVLLNDPFAGGTHLPDLTLVTPAFCEGRLVGFVASRAHHNDVGGAFPGSMGLGREIYQEGLRIPPLKLVAAGRLNAPLWELLLANVRVPDERRADLEAQLAAGRLGAGRLADLAARYTPELLEQAIAELCDYGERLMRRALAAIPDGDYRAHDVLDDDGLGQRDLRLEVTLRKSGEQVEVDFAGTAPQSAGPVNCPLAVTLAATCYAFRTLLATDAPTNAGCLRPLTLHVPDGSLLNARPPAAVAAGNVETSQRIVDLLFKALAEALPEAIPAASCGSMNNLTIGGRRADGRAFTYYETVAGGSGAGPDGDGTGGVHTHMTNTKNTPIEALEHSYPLRVRQYALRLGSGGRGRRRGGDGIRREIEALVPCEATLIGERRLHPPWGLAGGGAAQCGAQWVIRVDGRSEALPGKAVVHLATGDRLLVETPGGGGYGPEAAAPNGAPAASTLKDASR